MSGFLIPKIERIDNMKIFISQPMRAKTDKEILSERAKAIETVKERYHADVEVIDSFFQNAPTDAKPLWFLGKTHEAVELNTIAVQSMVLNI